MCAIATVGALQPYPVIFLSNILFSFSAHRYPLLPSFRLLFPWWWRCSGRRGSFPLCFGDRPWATVSERDRVQTRVGWAQARHHQLRQLRLRHADGVPVHHHGGLDGRAVLGTQTGHSVGGCMEGQRLLLTPHLPSHDIGVTRAHIGWGRGWGRIDKCLWFVPGFS